MEELELFFGRLKDARRRGPYGDVSIPDMRRVYSGEGMTTESNRFLRYFLNKLNDAIQSTRSIEFMVEQFVDVCNKYLSDNEESTDIRSDRKNKSENSYGKALRLNRLNISVSVESLAINKRIPMDALSSGEKQMISLFARLYLYENKKIILIDEPELSLSIDWQRQLLLDFMKAPQCEQVVAITHSPFVFDNELEPYASSMEVSVDMNAALKAVDTGSDIDNDDGELDE